jgi:hypothetical protein
MAIINGCDRPGNYAYAEYRNLLLLGLARNLSVETSDSH